MRDNGGIVGVPQEVYPRHIKFIVEFVEQLEKHCVVLNLEIKYTETTILLWSANHVPSRKGVTFVSIISFSDPQGMTPYFIQLFNDFWR